MSLEATADSGFNDLFGDLEVSETVTDDTKSTEPKSETLETPAVQQQEEKKEPVDYQKQYEELQRTIASDPELRARHLYQKYGVQPPQRQEQPEQQQIQQQYQEQAQPAQQQFQLPFSPDEFDATNFEHTQALITSTLQQQLAPFTEFVQQQQQENALHAQQMQQERQIQKQQEIKNYLADSIPGFKEFADLPNATEDQNLFLHMAATQYVQAMQALPSEVRFLPNAMKDTAKQIAPKLTKIGQALGVLTNASQSSGLNKKAMAVEGSSSTAQAAKKPVNSEFAELFGI